MKQARIAEDRGLAPCSAHLETRQHTHNTLVIGDITRWTAKGRDTADFGNFCFVTLDELSAALLLDQAPEIVLSPLVADGFDALDVAARLHELGFTGRYRVLAQGLPHVAIVSVEVAHVAPHLDFDVLEIPQTL